MNKKEEDHDEIKILEEKLTGVILPPELDLYLHNSLDRLARMRETQNFLAEYNSLTHYLDWVLALPWNKESPDNLDLGRAQAVLDKNHYGMAKVKNRLLEYLAVRTLIQKQKEKRMASVLCFIGLPGLGKTSVASSIAEALGRAFIRIPMGGLGEVAQLRGLPRYLPSAEPGQIIKGLRRAGCRNPVILFDEIDRVVDEGRSAIMGALLEILDPEQNSAFNDYFIDYPFNLSEVLFLCSANNTRGISNAVLDRLEIIEMPAYTDDEKIFIGRDYLLPRALKETGLTMAKITIEEDLWPKIIRPLGYDAGIRTLDRTIHGICRKIALKIVKENGYDRVFLLNEKNIKDFLPTW